MTSAIGEDGAVQAITLLAANPCVVTQVKTTETDGYTAIQLGTERANKIKKPQAGHFKPAKMQPKIVREFRIDGFDNENIKVGSTFAADIFNIGDTVHVTGTSKGKGFAGTIKRHGFHRQRKTHGGKGNTRQPGSIGSMYPQKIFKGKKMAGRMGHEQVTVRNLKVTLVDPEQGVIGVAGAVPGSRRSIVLVKEAA